MARMDDGGSGRQMATTMAGDAPPRADGVRRGSEGGWGAAGAGPMSFANGEAESR